MTTDYILIADDINPSLYPVVVVRTTEAGRIEERVMGTQETQDYLASLLAATPGAAFSVADYGATGDGVTDDTVAIQAAFTAIDAAGGGIAFFPPGTYLTSAQINIFGPNAIMRGSGPSTIIKAKANANLSPMFYIQSTASNFTAEAFTLDGNRDNLGTSGIYNTTCGLVSTDTVGMTFRDLEVKNVNAIGIALQATTAFLDIRTTFERCYIHHNGMLTAKEGNDVFLYNTAGTIFTDCVFEHGYGTGGGGLYAGGGVVGSYIEARFVNCIFRNNYNGGGQTGGQGYPLIDNRWAYIGCTFELTTADPHETCGIELQGRGCLIDGCEFYNHNAVAGTAIAFHGDFGAVGDEPGRIVITNNIFVGNTIGVGQTDTGDAGVVVIANNRFQDGTYGVQLGPAVGSPTTNVIIVGNDFTESVTTPISGTYITNLTQVGNLPATLDTKFPGDVRIGTNPASTATFGALGLPNDTTGAIMWRNAANDADVIGVHMGGNNRLYLMNAHNFGASDVTIAGILGVTGNTLNVATTNTPANAAATGTKGDIRWDASYFYICVATNTWHRTAHATW